MAQLGRSREEDAGGARDAGLAVEIAAGLERGDNVALLAMLETIVADPEAPEAERALAREAIRKITPDRLALGFFAGALCIWIVAFLLGIVVRHG